MEILISIATSICVCSIFMFRYEKKLCIFLKSFLGELEDTIVEVLKESRLHKF